MAFIYPIKYDIEISGDLSIIRSYTSGGTYIEHDFINMAHFGGQKQMRVTSYSVEYTNLDDDIEIFVYSEARLSCGTINQLFKLKDNPVEYVLNNVVSLPRSAPSNPPEEIRYYLMKNPVTNQLFGNYKMDKISYSRRGLPHPYEFYNLEGYITYIIDNRYIVELKVAKNETPTISKYFDFGIPIPDDIRRSIVSHSLRNDKDNIVQKMLSYASKELSRKDNERRKNNAFSYGSITNEQNKYINELDYILIKRCGLYHDIELSDKFYKIINFVTTELLMSNDSTRSISLARPIIEKALGQMKDILDQLDRAKVPKMFKDYDYIESHLTLF